MDYSLGFSGRKLPRVKAGDTVSAALLNKYVDALNGMFNRQRLRTPAESSAVAGGRKLPWDISITWTEKNGISNYDVNVAPVYGLGATVVQFPEPVVTHRIIDVHGKDVVDTGSGGIWIILYYRTQFLADLPGNQMKTRTFESAYWTTEIDPDTGQSVRVLKTREYEETALPYFTDVLGNTGGYAPEAIGNSYSFFSRLPLGYGPVAVNPIAGIAAVNYSSNSFETGGLFYGVGEEKTAEGLRIGHRAIIIGTARYDSTKKKRVITKYLGSPLFLPVWG